MTDPDHISAKIPAAPALGSPEEEAAIDAAFAEVLDGYMQSNHRKKVEIIQRAFAFARKAHQGIRRRSGEPYIMHPIAVARIASQEIGLGSTSICAALLHDVVEDTDYTVEDIRQQFGDKIAQLVEGLTKISGGIFGDKASAQAENFRKLLLTMSDDIRVVLIKMADRLHNMRTLGSMAPNKQYKIAGETLYIYAPLAHRLGLYAIKTELEDLSFKYEHPTAYRAIERQLAETSPGLQKVYRDFAAPIEKRLDAMGLHYLAKARIKSVYSIWHKMDVKKIPFEEVYDLYAMRIIFDCDDPAKEKEICWKIYAAITDLYRLHPDRTRDWVSSPKANGYQALHLTVMGADGNWVEVQIRSRRMDEIAEKGFAAHWKYKIGESDEESELHVWLSTIKDILENPEPSAIDFLNTLKLNLFTSEIVVFTPKGELLNLPAGATVLDMAFSLHSELGTHCIAAKVNHRLVPIGHTLKGGDQVEILTSQSQNPKPEWTDMLTTAKARTRLRAALRRQRHPMIARGRDRLEAFLTLHDIEDNNFVRTKLMGLAHARDMDDLCYMIGADEITLDTDFMVNTLKRVSDKSPGFFKKLLTLGRAKKTASEPSESSEMSEPSGTPSKNPSSEAPVDTKKTYMLDCRPDGEGANFNFAPCCRPIPGDDVMGFLEDDGTVTVHALTCPRAAVLKATYGPRVLAAEWHQRAAHFQAKIAIEGIDRFGLLHEITHQISSKLGLDMSHLEIVADREVFHCEITVRVEDADMVRSLCDTLHHIQGVTKVVRVS